MVEQGLVLVDSDRLTPIKVEEVKDQVRLIQDLMSSVMQEGQHFGVIPGTQKPTLLKPGAEKLCFTFRLTPSFDVEVVPMESNHREYRVTCSLKSLKTNAVWGEGCGSCSTMEVKYRYRESKRICPVCGKDAIRKSSEEKGGGWYCWRKIGGCGIQFKAGDQSIESQVVGRTENPDIADIYNTVLKMATKRAHVAATLYALAASDIFTQDMEDLAVQPEKDVAPEPPPSASPPPQEGAQKPEEAPEEPTQGMSDLDKAWVRVDELLAAKGWTKARLTKHIKDGFPESNGDPRKLSLLNVQAVIAYLITLPG